MIGWMGWDGMAITGHRSSKSTFGAYNIEEKKPITKQIRISQGRGQSLHEHSMSRPKSMYICTVFKVVQVCVQEQFDPLLFLSVGNSARKHQCA